MSELAFAVFDTAIGCCGIVWSERGVVGVQLPAKSERATRGQVRRRYPAAEEAAPPPAVQRAIDDIGALLRGEPKELGHVTIDRQDVPDFTVASTMSHAAFAPARHCPMARSPSGSAIATWRAMSRRRWGKIHFRSSCRVIACWRPAARWADFPRPAGFAPSCVCYRSRARGTVSPCCSIACPGRRPAAGRHRRHFEVHRRPQPLNVKAYLHELVEGRQGSPRGYHHGNLKEALLRAALELIAQKGPAGFTFAEAARWAGVSPAAPYRHFRDRDELLGQRGAARL